MLENRVEVVKLQLCFHIPPLFSKFAPERILMRPLIIYEP